MRGLGRRPSVEAVPQALCHRCRAPIPPDGRAVEARSIVDGTEPTLFHIECAPPPDSLRWDRRREIPMLIVRGDSARD